jgi:predicted tellurium resistance membrane protein TerC
MVKAKLADDEQRPMIFAVDSVPAIFAITTDPSIVYTSNIFAILGSGLFTLRLPRWCNASTTSSLRSPSC